MAGVAFAVLWIMLALLALVVAVLATRVRIGLALKAGPAWRLRIWARLLGGLTPAIPILDSARAGSKPKPAARPAAAKPRPKRHRRGGRAPARAFRAASAAPRLLSGLVRPIRLDRLSVTADIGLEDPADTGQLFGLIGVLNHIQPFGQRAIVSLRPDFSGPRLDGEVEAAVSFVPLAFLPPAARFGWRVLGPAR